MSATSILIKTDSKVKLEAQRTAKELGLSLSAVLNGLLQQFVKTKTITFSAKELDEIPNEYFKRELKQARADWKAGKGSPLFTDKEELVRKDPKKYRHIDTMEQWLNEQGV